MRHLPGTQRTQSIRTVASLNRISSLAQPCGGLDMDPRTYEYDYIWYRGTITLVAKDVMKDFERRAVLWVIEVGPKCNHMYP